MSKKQKNHELTLNLVEAALLSISGNRCQFCGGLINCPGSPAGESYGHEKDCAAAYLFQMKDSPPCRDCELLSRALNLHIKAFAILRGLASETPSMPLPEALTLAASSGSSGKRGLHLVKPLK